MVMLDGSDVVGSWVGGKPVDGVEFLVARAGIATAAARTMADGGEVLNAAERVTVAQALRGNTIDAAWMCHADALVGSLEAGKAADFVLLADDPLAHEDDPDAVREIALLATYLDGAEVHSA